MRTLLLVIVILFLCNACNRAPAPTELSPPQPTALAQRAPTLPIQAPTSSPPTLPVAPTTGISTATALSSNSPHPAWIAMSQGHYPFDDGMYVSPWIHLVDADTGQVVPQVCRSEGGLAWSATGTWLACVGIGDMGKGFVTLVNAVDPTQTFEWELPSSPGHAGFRAWSPVEQVLAVSTDTAIYLLVPDAATQPRVLKTCAGYRCSAVAWSPDGQRLATNDWQGLSVVTIADGSEVSITDEGIYLSGSPSTTDTALEAVAYAPDGTQIAYTAQDGIYVVAAAGGEARQLIQATSRGTHLAWSDDGRVLSFLEQFGPLRSVAIDGSGNNQGEIVAQNPELVSAPYRCTVSMRPTDEVTVRGMGEMSYNGLIYDLFLRFTGSEAVVQLTSGGIHEPIVLQANEMPPVLSPLLIGAWAPGPVRVPILARSDPPMRGCAVLELQTRLAERGISPGAVDGIYGSSTEAAVRAFQQANNLTVDGIVGPQTWDALGGWSW